MRVVSLIFVLMLVGCSSTELVAYQFRANGTEAPLASRDVALVEGPQVCRWPFTRQSLGATATTDVEGIAVFTWKKNVLPANVTLESEWSADALDVSWQSMRHRDDGLDVPKYLHSDPRRPQVRRVSVPERGEPTSQNEGALEGSAARLPADLVTGN